MIVQIRVVGNPPPAERERVHGRPSAGGRRRAGPAFGSEHSAEPDREPRLIPPPRRARHILVMNAGKREKRASVDSITASVAFGSLVPWMTRAGRTEISNLWVASSAVPARLFTRAALHASEQVLRQLFDNSPISVAVFEPAGRLLRFNRAFATMLGHAVADLSERCIDEFVHPDDVPPFQERRRMLMEGRCDEFALETRFGTGCHRQVWTRMHGRLERPEVERSPLIFAHIVDLTEFEQIVKNFRHDAEEACLKNWNPERYL